MSTPAIVIRELRKSVSASFNLGPLSLEIPRGAICALIGPNGAGKTTLLNLLMGTDSVDAGCASVLGHDVAKAAVAIKQHTALVSPDISYRAWGSVGRAIDFVSGFYPDWDAGRCELLLSRMGLRRGEAVDSLSFGGRVKLSLVLALARNARLLLLDEPSIGLDPLGRQQLFTELMAFMQDEERTIVISSHQLTELERYADYVAILNRGQVIAHGSTPELLARYTELDVLRDGARTRVLRDRSSMKMSADPDPSELQIIGERSLTLEELLVALVKSNSGVRWQPRMDLL